jgi:hypothetical protein
MLKNRTTEAGVFVLGGGNKEVFILAVLYTRISIWNTPYPDTKKIMNRKMGCYDFSYQLIFVIFI